MNDPAAVADAMGLTVEELADVFRREAARAFLNLADVIEDVEQIPDTGYVMRVLLLIEACEDEYDRQANRLDEGGGVSTKEATSAGVTAPIRVQGSDGRG